MENLYEILQIDNEVDEKEIKKAYIKMLRKYPPEKSPEEFKKIREAYERLSNPISRAEYDAESLYKDEIDELFNNGIEAFENEDYINASTYFKKILLIEPKLSYAKNMLGLSLFNDEKYDAALKQFQELIDINPGNATYYYNLGITYKKIGYIQKAINSLVKANEIDPINDNIIITLSNYYIENLEITKAIEFLKKCIERDSVDDFQDFIYYFQIVQIYIITNDEDGLKETLNKIENIIPEEDVEARVFAGWKLAKLAYDLFNLKMFDLSEKVSKKALEIDENNTILNKLYDNSHELAVSFKLMKELIEDKSIIEVLKSPLIIYFFHDEFKNEQEKEEFSELSLKNIEDYLYYDYDNVIESINKIKNRYYQLYKIKGDFYDKIKSLAYENRKRHNAFKQLEKDGSINESVKALIALYLSTDISGNERKEYLNNILLRMRNDTYWSITRSIENLKSDYPELYNLNPEFFDDIKEMFCNTNNMTRRVASSSSSGCLLAIVLSSIKIISIVFFGYYLSNIIA